MAELSVFTRNILVGCMIFLSIVMCLCLFRAIIGPRFTDRLVAINMIGTLTIVFICLLSVFLEEAFLVDVALVYTLISFLSVVMLCRIVTNHHKGRQLFLERKKQEQEAHQND